MKTRIRMFLSGVVLLLAMTSLANAQATLTTTTLSSAVTSKSANTVVVASATGITAGTTMLYIDREALDVLAVSGTTLTVSRGIRGTKAYTHVSAAAVYLGPPKYFAANDQIGSCTRSNEVVLPRINIIAGSFSDCLNGQWVTSDIRMSTYGQPKGIRLPDPGATALTALETSGTAPSAATEQYCSEINLPTSMLVTGLGVLNGTTVGADKRVVILYDAGGNVLANSAVAGATSSGASTYQKFDFTSKYLAAGPNRYFACVQTNGTTDTIRHAITAVNDNINGGAVTTQVFGTVIAVTLPSTFTTAKAPYFLVY